MIRRFAIAAAVGLGALCAGPAAAVAHPLLVTAAPAPGAIIPGSPSALTLAFSETAVPRGSAVTVTGPAGRAVRLGRLKAGDGGAQLGAALPGKLSPGVYRVHWVALGQDGHTVAGDFAFGVAEGNGAPPPGASGLGGVGGGRGGAAGGEGAVTVVLRWLGILAASLLWGGVLLAALVRRRDPAAGDRVLSRLDRPLRLALVLTALTALYGCLQLAGAGAGGGIDLSLLTASGTGISALVRLALALGGTLAVLATPKMNLDLRARVLAGLGLGLLVTYGLSGHVLAQGNGLAALGMALHVVAAGAWAGGLIALLVLVRSGDLAVLDGARAFAPLAFAGLGIAAVTGAIAAIREVSHWYFLWWSGYGRLVIAKVLVVAAASAAGATLAWRARAGGRTGGSGRETGRAGDSGARAAAPRSPRLRGLGIEAGLVVAVLAIAATLSGLAQGRGQPLPAQRGDLLPGPALASVLLSKGPAPVTLAPARTGVNRIVVIPHAGTHSVLVRLGCGCDVRPVIASLHPDPGSGGAFSASIPVPSAGTWNAYITVDGVAAATPVALDVGVPGAPGAPVRNVLAVADLSGPGAARCRSYLVGMELAIGRLNGSGGVDGGHKLALLALDDGGSPAQGATIASSALSGSGSSAPVALASCGAGAEPALAQASRVGIPAISGDPATGDVAGPRVFRVAGDPYADGVAIAQAIGSEILPVAARTARVVKVVSVADAQGQRRLEGLKDALKLLKPAVRIEPVSSATLTSAGPSALAALLNRSRTVALVLDATDAQAPALEAAFRRLPARAAVFTPAPVVASERVLSESFIDASGGAGRLGVIQGTSTVAVDSRDGLTLSQAIPALFPGERASLEGLRGYVAGLALDDGVRAGTAPATISARLTRPLPFTDAIPEPWRADAPAAGAQRLGVLEPTFLSTTLIPASQGGESYSGEYFSDGAWMRPTSSFYGPSLQAPVAAVGRR